MLPSGRNITPCKGCFLKYNVDAFAGRTVTTPNGSVVADLFWYGAAAATFGDMRSNPTWNVNMSMEKSFKMWERYSVNLAAQTTNLFNNTQFKPGLNTSFGATILPSGKLLDTPTNSTNTWGTYTQNTYDARQLELVMRIRF